MPCTAATASSCRPRESKNLGDSYRWKRKKRHRNITKVIAPSVMTRYLQPILSSFLHGPSSEQVKFGMKAQARRLDTKLPTGHHTLSIVRRFPDANGRNSRKRAPSTGKFPPTPRPKQAYSAQVLQLLLTNWDQYRPRHISTYPIQFGPPPEARPKAPLIMSVKLNAGRRPIISEAMPQNDAPRQRPRNRAQVVKRTRFSSTPNSSVNWGNVSATPYGISMNIANSDSLGN